MSLKALLVIGSAKASKSTSQSLGSFLLQGMAKRGCETETLFLHRIFRFRPKPSILTDALDRCDTLILAFPLYVDCLPYLVTAALETIAAHRQADAPPKSCRLVAIVNSGFPEVHHSDTALAICRKFAKDVGMDWAGALVLGGGEAIDGKPLNEVKLMARNALKSLGVAAGALARNRSIPEEAVELMARPMIPRWLYLFLGKRGWLKKAKNNGVRSQLDRRPYA